MMLRTVATIFEVAKRAGVSTATVSRVLSNPSMVAPETRRKVLAAVERLRYAPNSAAKNLRMLRSRKLLVTVPDISRPLFSLILQGIEESADRAGYSVLLGDTHYDQGREERYAAMLCEKQADGLIAQATTTYGDFAGRGKQAVDEVRKSAQERSTKTAKPVTSQSAAQTSETQKAPAKKASPSNGSKKTQ